MRPRTLNNSSVNFYWDADKCRLADTRGNLWERNSCRCRWCKSKRVGNIPRVVDGEDLGSEKNGKLCRRWNICNPRIKNIVRVNCNSDNDGKMEDFCYVTKRGVQLPALFNWNLFKQSLVMFQARNLIKIAQFFWKVYRGFIINEGCLQVINNMILCNITDFSFYFFFSST